MHDGLGGIPESAVLPAGSPQSTQGRPSLGRNLFGAGATFIIVAAAISPLVGAILDTVVKRQALGSSLALREVVNLSAAGVAVAVLRALTNRPQREITTTRAVVGAAVITMLVLGMTRLALQLATGIIDSATDFRWIALESSVWVVFMPMMATVLILVTLRERIIDSQTILLDEARHALQDDHESLRARVFDHLHGTVQSELVVARVRIADLAREITDNEQATALRAIADRLRHLQEDEVRRLAHGLVAEGLESSVEDALVQLAESCQGMSSVRTHVDPALTACEAHLDPDARAALRLTIYRIVEECVSNALRHAHATDIDVDVHVRTVQRRTEIEIVVSNDLEQSISATPLEGLGLRVMRARASAYRGEVAFAQVDDRFRTSVSLEVPTAA